VVNSVQNGDKTANIKVKKFYRSLTTVLKAQNDTSKIANITDAIFNRNKVIIAAIDISSTCS